MPFIITVVATKGGVGKTTIAANLAAMLRDLGFRVLLIDADIQPSLSGYYALVERAPQGLSKLIKTGYLDDDCVSTILLPLDSYTNRQKYPQKPDIKIVLSDTRDGNLHEWLSERLDPFMRLHLPLRKQTNVGKKFDVVLIDTQGAIGKLQDAATFAADMLIAPVTPDMLSTQEFIPGVVRLMERTEQAASLGLQVPNIKGVINRIDNTKDAKEFSALIWNQFLNFKGKVTVAETAIPRLAAFNTAASTQTPVHWIDPKRASDAIHHVLWEIMPNLAGKYAPNHVNYGQPCPEYLTNKNGSCESSQETRDNKDKK